MPRLFVAEPLRAAATLALPAPAARHVQVLRLQPGETITLFNGADGLDWAAEIVRIGRRDVEVRVGAATAVERELPCAVTLAVGVPANDRMDALVEKAAELGAAAIQPLLCERSVLRLSAERAAAKARHWQAVAAAASEQCGRALVTEVLAVQALPAWLAGAGAAAPARRLVLSLDPDAATVAAAMSGGGGPAATGAVIVLSGPEGGLGDDEERAAVARGFVRVGLGPRVLRADTAPLAVLAWLGVEATRAGR